MTHARDPLNVLVLCGGPDAEREVSLKSGAAVAAALERAGHHVAVGDLQPNDTAALDRFVEGRTHADRAGVVFPALHGPWGEGGPAQWLLEDRGVPYVGCRPSAAARCMDKAQTKDALQQLGLPTPAFEEHSDETGPCTLTPPVVLKPTDQGSSVGLTICHDQAAIDAHFGDAVCQLCHVLVERFVAGKELTVGWVEGLGDESDPGVLPPIWIKPAVDFYDYEAKYNRDDTIYAFDLEASPEVERQLRELTRQCVQVLGIRHLARIDFILDADGTPWILEANTMPGFTDHSLLPKAAAHAGTDMATLCDHLVRLALK